jgi:hypothetical protein
MGSSLPSWVIGVLSQPRIDGYLAASSGDVDGAVVLYRWNVEVSAAFAVPLHWVEMGFRNALHSRLAVLFGRDDWWGPAPLDANGQRKVTEAQAVLRRLGKDPAVSDSVVAELSFGFWVSLLASRYHRTLWMPVLWRAFPGRNRHDVHADYRHVLQLRNRISHGEPIHRRHLEADHLTVYRLLGELSPDALHEMTQHDPVPAVLARRGAW